MKRIVALLLVGGFCLHMSGQNVTDTKVEINKIKRSKLYLSAEATMATEEEAMNTAKELLVSEINGWVASKKGNTPVKQIVLQDINSCTQLMDMKRGIKTRAFVYVKKKDIVLIYGEGQIVLNDEEKGEVELQSLGEVSRSKPLATEEPPMEPLERILSARTMQELKPIFAELNEAGKISYGVYSQKDLDCYLLFYTRTGEIKGILRREAGNLENVHTGAVAKMTDYNGCGAYWFKLK